MKVAAKALNLHRRCFNGSSMGFHWAFSGISLGFSLIALHLIAVGYAPAQVPVRDTRSDTWAAVDGLGRSVVMGSEASSPKEDKWVGMFYFLWLGHHTNSGPFDITKILSEHPNAINEPDHPAWGNVKDYHHWGEPLFGYYLSGDEWVIRKHAQMLSDAGVDTLIFDVSNTFTYKENYMTLLKVFSDVRAEGGKTPQIAFLCPFSNHMNYSASTVEKLYEELYGPGLYEDLWFMWDGKPLIIALPEQVDPEIRKFFTFRKPWADYFTGPYDVNVWGWLQIHPQHAFYNDRGELEEMPVGIAQNAQGNDRLAAMSEDNTRGRSWSGGRRSPAPNAVDWGLNFGEQWELALRINPKFVFITGWNEWVAMYLEEFNGVSDPPMFVDVFTQEYSRDIEPMKGGHSDNYYYQLVDNVRKYKGARISEEAGIPVTIEIDGEFDDWERVEPEFLDDLGDIMHRKAEGWGESGLYINETGRNDIAAVKVAYDESAFYFLVEIKGGFEGSRENDWMWLFINADAEHDTGWEGYDFLFKPNESILYKCIREDWNWEEVDELKVATSENAIEVAIPRKILASDDASSALHFKWTDNTLIDGDILNFTLNGDTAPNNRFSYVFTGFKE